MAKTKKEINFPRLAADVFKEKLAKAGFNTIVRIRCSNFDIVSDVHIQGTRKKHLIMITKCGGRRASQYTIRFKSDRLRTTYLLWESGDIRIENPDFDMDFGDIADKVIDFMERMKILHQAEKDAHAIFDPSFTQFPGPLLNKKRVSRSSL